MKSLKTIGILLLVAVLSLACEEPGPIEPRVPIISDPAPTQVLDPVDQEYNELREKLKDEYGLE